MRLPSISLLCVGLALFCCIPAKEAAPSPTDATNGASPVLEDGVFAYEDKNYPEALKIFRALAEKGDAEAQFNLGKMSFLGQGMPEDKTEAVKWFRAAAENGHAEARLFLDLLLKVGAGAPKDYIEATKWFYMAAEKGNTTAWTNLAELSRRMPKDGLSEDDKATAIWTRKIAELGDREAQNNLAWMYEVGRGVSIDKGEATKCFRMAAEQGHAGAQYQMGLKCLKGEGVPVDLDQAKKWLRLSAKGGLPDASYKLATLEQDKPQLIIPVMLGESLWLQAESFLAGREIPYDGFRWIDYYDSLFQGEFGEPVFSKVWNAAGDYRIAEKPKDRPHMLELIVRVIDPREKTKNFGVSLGMPMRLLKEEYASKGLDLQKGDVSTWWIGGRSVAVETYDAVPLEKPFPSWDNIKYISCKGVLVGFSARNRIKGSYDVGVEKKPQEAEAAEKLFEDAGGFVDELNAKFGKVERSHEGTVGEYIHEWNTNNMWISLVITSFGDPTPRPTRQYFDTGFSCDFRLKGNVVEYFIGEFEKAGSKQ